MNDPVSAFEESPLHILLIEDDDAMRAMLAEALRHEGWKVTECENAYRWLQYCMFDTGENPASHDDAYDVVISDICMPGMSGLEAMTALKDLCLETPCPPTILITAFGDEETHQQAKELGAAMILDKPFDTKDLINSVRNIVIHEDNQG
ncbi:MAG: response regulator [Candidatus Hydrogenedentota bacterium]